MPGTGDAHDIRRWETRQLVGSDNRVAVAQKQPHRYPESGAIDRGIPVAFGFSVDGGL